MEFNAINFSAYLTIFLIISVLLFIYNRYFPELMSRLTIGNAIEYFLYNKHYKLIEHIDIPVDDGKNIHIKQLIISRYGLFIIQTCHYRNTIFGSNHQVKWLSQGKRAAKVFLNPNISNQHLCEILANYLQICPSTCHLINVFTGNSKLPFPTPENMCKPDSLVKTISEYRYVHLNPDLLSDIKSVLLKV